MTRYRLYRRAAALALGLTYALPAWAIVLLAFFIIAIQLFVTLIEFKLVTLAGFVLVPFGLFGRTAFLAERVLGNVMATGIKVLERKEDVVARISRSDRIACIEVKQQQAQRVREMAEDQVLQKSRPIGGR